jgi:hypothetical protein
MAYRSCFGAVGSRKSWKVASTGGFAGRIRSWSSSRASGINYLKINMSDINFALIVMLTVEVQRIHFCGQIDSGINIAIWDRWREEEGEASKIGKQLQIEGNQRYPWWNAFSFAILFLLFPAQSFSSKYGESDSGRM